MGLQSVFAAALAAWALFAAAPGCSAPAANGPVVPPAPVENESTLEQESVAIVGEIERHVAVGDDQGALALARSFYTTTLERFKADSVATGRARLILGRVELHLRAYSEALASFDEAARLSQRWLGPAHAETGRALRYLAHANYELEQFDKAAELAARAVRLLEAALGEKHPEVAAAWSTLGYARLETHDPVAARDAWERALSVREQALGPNHELVGVSAATLAKALSSGTDDRRVERLYRQALRIFEQHLDARVEHFADVATRLAAIDDKKEPGSGEALIRRALALVESVRNRRDPDYLRLSMALLTRFAETSRYAELDAMLRDHGGLRRCVPKVCSAGSRTPRSGRSITPGGVPESDVTNATRVISGLRSDFMACYDRAIAESPGLRGSATLELRVDRRGAVAAVESVSLGLPESIIACALEVAHAAKFAPPSGGSAEMVIPLTFLTRQSSRTLD